MDLFKLEPGLAIWTWITFGILFFILWKFVLPIILGNITKREEYISSAVDNASKIENRLKEVQDEREAIIKAANKEADEILHRTRDDAEALRKNLVKKAEDEAASIIEQAKQSAVEERATALQSLQDEIADLICEASDTVVGMAVTGEKEKAWARETVKAL